MKHLRTAFEFDPMPWKLEFCELALLDCPSNQAILIKQLPQPLAPSRVPEGVNHVHIVLKGEERDAREQEKWRALMFSTGRCKHGRMMGDKCSKCGLFAPDLAGTLLGHTIKGVEVRVPERDDMNDIKKWTERD